MHSKPPEPGATTHSWRDVILASGVLFIGLALAQMATGLLVLLLARSVRPATYGLVTAALGAATVSLDIADMGLSSWLVIQLQNAPRDVSATVQGVLHLKTIMSAVVALALLGGFALLLGPVKYLTVAALALWVLPAARQQTQLAALRAQHRSAAAGGCQAVSRWCALLIFLCSTIIDPSASATAFCVAIAVGETIGVISTSRILARSAQRKGSGGGLGWRILLESRHLAFAGFFSDLQLADTAIVAAGGGALAAGMYALPARLTGPLGLLSTAVSQRVLPMSASGRMSRKSLMLLAVVLAVLSALIALPLLAWSRPIIRLIGGSQYEMAVEPLRLFAIAMVPASVNQLLAAWLQGTGSRRYVSMVVGAFTCVELPSIWWSSRLFGAVGACWVFLALQTIVVSVFVSRVLRTAE